MDKVSSTRTGLLRASSDLRPPPLFRSIGLPGLLASLPPHRRLRFILCRSTAVLPTEASDTNALTELQTESHVHTEISSLDCTETVSGHSTALDALRPEVGSDLRRRAVSESGPFTAVNSLILKKPQTQIKLQDRELSSHLSASAKNNGKYRQRQARLVTPFQTTEDCAVKKKQQQNKRKTRHKGDCAGKQKYVAPSPVEKEDGAKLCEWLESLGVTDGDAKSFTITNSQQQLFVSRCSRMEHRREPDSVAGQRRDRRPHFLPPIFHGDSLLHVPLLIPKNTPPPSPCSHPATSIHALSIPLLEPLSLRRKSTKK